MVEVKCNFEFGKTGLKCSLGCDTSEDQEHVLHCPVLIDNELTPLPHYVDIYSNNQTKIKMVTQALIKKYAKFTILKSSTVHGQSPQTKPSAAKPEDTVNDVDKVVVNLNVVNCSALELE